MNRVCVALMVIATGGCSVPAHPPAVDGAVAVDTDAAHADAVVDSAVPDAGYLGDCPADAPVDIQRLQTPWSEADPADAYLVLNIPAQAGRHYRKAVIDFDMDVGPLSAMVAIWLLRNKQVSNASPYHHWFGGSLKRNGRTVLYINNFSGPEDNGQWIAKTWSFTSGTRYHVHYEYDAQAGTALLRYTGEDGSQLRIDGIAHASIAAAGAGLKLEIGIPTSHPDYPTVMPPAGWAFRDVHVRLEPGGPFGDAMPCQ